ncbi:MAG: right-handed parallel beta-helix repeat-containing protein [Candidatus Bipolaricaulota bacterium]|nr:right-handed parallel beta-helix repeat-containing protein [Candidatus Bipolaricaulota bacterium]
MFPKTLNRRYWVIFGSVGVIAIVAIVAIWVLMVSPQTLTICPSGCAFSQIQPALDAARRGSTLQIQSGTYQENLSITKPVHLIGQNATLQGQITISKTENVSITTLTINGPVRIEESKKITLEYNTILESPTEGIAIIKSDGVVLHENTIAGNGGDGVRVESSRAEIHHNIIGGNKGYGIAADSASQLSGEDNRSGYRVPQDFQTIQAAIDAWDKGMGINGLGDVNENTSKELLTGDGVIFIASGVYKEPLTIREKTIRIRGADRETVIIDGTGLGDVDGITLRGTAKVFLENLTVRNFRDDGIDAEGKIELTLRNVILESNGSTGAEIAHTDVTVWLTKSVIRNNRTYGLWALSAQNIVECRETSVAENTTDFGALNEAAAAEIAQKCQ